MAPQPGQEPGSHRYQWSLDGKAVGDTLQVFTTVPDPGKHRCELAVVDAKGKALRRSTVEFTSIAAEETKA